jgi:hypothetical protein
VTEELSKSLCAKAACADYFQPTVVGFAEFISTRTAPRQKPI